jgi:thiamine biosynthesis lipoprotein
MSLTRVQEGWRYNFHAMASPCEVRVETKDRALAKRLGGIAEAEATRIEAKYSRYRPDSVVSRINRSDGEPVTVDRETAALLNYAENCHRLSGGLFDITSGALRRVWSFDGSDRLPSRAAVEAVLPLVGWSRAYWRRPVIVLKPGMEIDLGGLGKEYAVDRAMMKIMGESDRAVLVNFGGDLRVSGPRARGVRWQVAIESVEAPGGSDGRLELLEGALTTSGDARRYLLKDGVRYSHILDPRTGWPVRNPPRAVTVAAATCMEAGVLSTLAMLKGEGAEAFLKAEKIQAWCARQGHKVGR